MPPSLIRRTKETPVDEAALTAAGSDPDQLAYRQALGSFATGVAVVTTALPDGSRAGLTVNSFTSVSLDPRLVSWCQVISAPTLSLFSVATHFAVNVLAVDQVELAHHFAHRLLDKFDGVAGIAGLGGAPLLDGVAAIFECRTAMRYEGGDHVIHLGEVERFARFDREPLIRVTGRYGRLAGG